MVSLQKFSSVPKTEINKNPNNCYKFLLNVSNVLRILSTNFSMFYVLPVLTLTSKTQQSSLNLLYHQHTIMTDDIPKDDTRAAQNNLTCRSILMCILE